MAKQACVNNVKNIVGKHVLNNYYNFAECLKIKEGIEYIYGFIRCEKEY
mgnify:CR=1 FL=1